MPMAIVNKLQTTGIITSSSGSLGGGKEEISLTYSLFIAIAVNSYYTQGLLTF